MVPSTQGRILRAHVHFQMLEEIVVFMRRERNKDTHSSWQRSVHQRLTSSRNQGSFLKRNMPRQMNWMYVQQLQIKD